MFCTRWRPTRARQGAHFFPHENNEFDYSPSSNASCSISSASTIATRLAEALVACWLEGEGDGDFDDVADDSDGGDEGKCEFADDADEGEDKGGR
jgi:hypothetical protein